MVRGAWWSYLEVWLLCEWEVQDPTKVEASLVLSLAASGA